MDEDEEEEKGKRKRKLKEWLFRKTHDDGSQF